MVVSGGACNTLIAYTTDNSHSVKGLDHQSKDQWPTSPRLQHDHHDNDRDDDNDN